MTKLEIMEKLSGIISKIVDENLPVDESVVLREMDENKVSLGLSSLDMMDLIIQIEMEFGIEIEQESYADLYDVGNLVLMITNLLNKRAEEENNLVAIEKDLFN